MGVQARQQPYEFIMAVGKNKKLMKGKKGGKKKIIDPFTRKEWYDVKAPNLFKNRQVGKTLVTRTIGTKIASANLKGRVLEACVADLNNDEEQAFLQIRLRIEDVQGSHCLTNFHGMRLSTDKVKGLVRKWQSLIEATMDVKTTDGYVLRLFCIGFTKKRQNQVKGTAYAQTAQIQRIRRRMFGIMNRESQCDLKDLVTKLVPNTIGKKIEKRCTSIYPLKDVYIRKVKVIKTPKFDPARLMELPSDSRHDAGKKVARQ